jgi:NitT/TauT family transport system ATP-binding protein
MSALTFSERAPNVRRSPPMQTETGQKTPEPTNAGNGAPLIALEGVLKRFGGGTLAVAHMTMAVGRGEFVCLVGPSGCGKTTVLRLLAGLVSPSSGRLIVSQIEGAGGSLETGFVFQDPTLMPWATVLANVALPLRLAGVGRTKRRAAARKAIDLVGLGGFGDAFPRELSGGMKMRASIARALVTGPELLLMDEPFAALDEMARQGLNDDLGELWARTGATVVFVTHSVFEAVNLAQRVLVMGPRPGRIVGEIAVDRGGMDARDFRASPAYGETCRQVSLLLTQNGALAGVNGAP